MLPMGRFSEFADVRFSSARQAATGPNSAAEWNALQFHRTLFVGSNPDQDKQSTELRNAAGFAERNANAEIAGTRV